MSTLTAKENAVAALPRREQQKLLRRPSANLHVSAMSAQTLAVPSPKVSKTESQGIARRIEGVFGGAEWENWDLRSAPGQTSSWR